MPSVTIDYEKSMSFSQLQRRLFRSFPLKTVLWSVVLCMWVAHGVISPAIAQQTRVISLQSKITGVQPMTGIALWADNPIAERHPEAVSLEYRYCGYDEIVDAQGRYDWTSLESVLDEIAARNHQAILRFNFVYVGKKTTVPGWIRQRNDYHETVGKSEGKETWFCDWGNKSLQEFMLDFYRKLADRYDRDPRIAFLQTGFGLWAEYHIYDGPRKLGKTFPDKSFQEVFLRHMDAQFDTLPWSISIDAADETYSPLEDNADLLALDFGVFDDSFLCKPHSKENAVNWRILGPDRWKRQPGGGEFSYYNNKDQRQALSKEGPNGVPFEVAAKQFHLSYIIGNDQPRFQSIERIKSASRAIGYRFRVTAAAVKGNELRLRVTNEGIAPIYRDAYFAAGKKRSTKTLKGLLPGESCVCSVSGVSENDLRQITIVCDSVLPTQSIQFDANLQVQWQ